MDLRQYILSALLIGFVGISYGQDTKSLDSLKRLYYATTERQVDPVLLYQIAGAESSPDSVLKYSRLAFESNKADANDSIRSLAYQRHGVEWRRKAEYDKSLEYLYMAAEIIQELENDRMLGNVNIEIASTYSESKEFDKSVPYFIRGLEYLEKVGDSVQRGKALYNLGDNLYEKGELDSALVYTNESRAIFQQYKEPYMEAYSLGNLGRIYAGKNEYKLAEPYLKEAIEKLREINDYNALTDFLATLSEIYAERGNLPAAISYAEQSLEAAEQHDLKNDLQNAHLKLSNLYEQAGDLSEAFEHFKSYEIYKDSIKNVATVQEMADLRTNFELARKQTEVDLLNEQKNNQRNIVIATVIALFLIMLLALGLYRRNKYIGRTKKIIEEEKSRSDHLLLNILPQETAIELKEKGKVQAKRFDSASVLFTDFKNFTHYAENLPPEELVKSVDFYFSKFDEIVERHGVEKIKTVGDAYMCAAGVPFSVEDHARRIVAAACEMVKFVYDARRMESEKETRFEVRIGINSGPVVAGVVGHKKWAYDIWGDTVNIAARMETCSENGKVNISENTYRLIKEDYECDYRGEIMVKNKGMMKMYFIKGIKNPAKPNVAFNEVPKK